MPPRSRPTPRPPAPASGYQPAWQRWDLLADLAEDLHERGMALWVAAPSQRPPEMLRRAAEPLGRSDLEADTGRLGVRVFPRRRRRC